MRMRTTGTRTRKCRYLLLILDGQQQNGVGGGTLVEITAPDEVAVILKAERCGGL